MLDENEKQRLQRIERSGKDSADFERAILLTGYGRYHIALTIACSLGALAVGFQNGLSAYILPAAHCDLNLSTSQMGLLNTAFLIGSTASAMLWGVVADAIGRRPIMIWCLLIDGSVTLLSSLSQNFAMFFTLRIINGFFVGGPASVIVSYLGEFFPEKRRSTAICYLGLSWTISWLLLPALAWIIIPLEFEIVVYGWMFNSWRLFVGIFSIPSLLTAYLISEYPETPKFLLTHGNDKEALQIMRQIFASNNNKEEHEYPITTLIHDHPATNNKSNSTKAILNKMWHQLCYLFSPPLLKYTALSGAIMFTSMFGQYGLGLWLPELFNRFEAYYKDHPNESISVCELASLRLDNIEPMNARTTEHPYVTPNVTSLIISVISNLTTTELSTSANIITAPCETSVHTQVFINTLANGFSSLLGSIASIYLAGRVDSRIMPVTTMVIPGICGCLIYFLRTATQNLIVSCIFSSLMGTANIVISAVIVDAFPTNVGSMAVCSANLAGRFGSILSNLLFGLLLDISCEIPIFLVGGFLIIGGLLAILLPTHPIGVPEKQGEKKDDIRLESLENEWMRKNSIQ